MEVSRSGETAHPGIQAIWMANIINRQSGGVVITPWEIDQLPEEWIDLYIGLITDLTEMKKAQAQVQAYREQFRQTHPTYRKY